MPYPTATIIYMLVSSPINIELDFLSLYERDISVQDRFSHEPGLLCQSRGLSVYEEKKDILRLRRRVRRLRNHAIGYRKITSDSGVIKPTSSRFGQSHRTWWVPVGVEPWNGFKIEEI